MEKNLMDLVEDLREAVRDFDAQVKESGMRKRCNHYCLEQKASGGGIVVWACLTCGERKYVEIGSDPHRVFNPSCWTGD